MNISNKHNINIDSDKCFMKKAIEIGRSGMNLTSPNPRVGCVLVKNGKIIGSGYHKRFGSDHAEVEAINSAQEDVDGSTAYITLEPCSHYGKTPPCVDHIVQQGIKRVVIGAHDPNLEVNGIEFLKERGIEVKVGVMEAESKELIKDYLKFTMYKKPYVTVKVAMSWDGKIATKSGVSQWITGMESRDFAMRLRGENDAILVGINTVNCDNPELTYRLKVPVARQPLRVLIDRDLVIDLKSRIIKEDTLIITTPASGKEKKRKIRKTGAEIAEIEDEKGIIPPRKIIEYLYDRNIISLFIEGGGTTIGNFLFNNEVDRVIFIYGSIIIGGSTASTGCDGPGFVSLKESLKLKNIKRFNKGHDFVMQGDIA